MAVTRWLARWISMVNRSIRGGFVSEKVSVPSQRPSKWASWYTRSSYQGTMIDRHIRAMTSVRKVATRPPMIPLTRKSRTNFSTRSVEGQHGPRDLTGLHRAERHVDVAQPPALADHLVELQPALAVEIEIARDVGAELVAAHA